MELKLLVLIESSDESKADGIYFSEVRRRFYTNFAHDHEGEVSIDLIPLNGKQNYNNEKIVKRIDNNISMNTSFKVDTAVIYCLDTDSLEDSYKEGSFFYNVQKYCSDNNYDLVWFCKNVENVFLNKEVGQVSSKIEEAKTFARSDSINKIDEWRLSKQRIEYGCSNILCVLDKYLKRK